jgi:uncharacterized membrane protein YvbJ
MALINCHECAKQVSEKASSCPHCGNPITKAKTSAQKRAGGKWEAAGFILIVASIIMGFSGKMETASVVGVIGFIVFLVGRFK